MGNVIQNVHSNLTVNYNSTDNSLYVGVLGLESLYKITELTENIIHIKRLICTGDINITVVTTIDKAINDIIYRHHNNIIDIMRRNKVFDTLYKLSKDSETLFRIQETYE